MEETRVRDVMLLLDEYATVSSRATIQEALLALSKAQLGLTYDRHHHRAILVLDDAGRVVGKLTHMAVLISLGGTSLGTDDIESLRRVNLSDEFIDSVIGGSRPARPALSRLCEQAARIRVSDAMVLVNATIDEEASLSEAVSEMVEAGAESMIVTRNHEVVGVLRLSDVFEEVADLIRHAARC